METSYFDVPILESVTNIAKGNNGAQEVYLYYEKSYLELNKTFKIDNLDQQNYGTIYKRNYW